MLKDDGEAMTPEDGGDAGAGVAAGPTIAVSGYSPTPAQPTWVHTWEC